MSVTKCTRTNNGKKVTFYRAQVYVDGVRLADKTFETALAAHAWHDREKTRLVAGEEWIDAELTLGDCLRRFRAEAMPRLKRSSQQVKEVRLIYLEQSPIANVPMPRLHSRVVDEWIRWLLKHPTADNPGRKSFENELKLLSVVLHWYKNYVNAAYVVPITKRHRELVRYKEKKARRPDYFARPEEIQKWIAWLAEHRRPVYARLARFMVLTGARVSEATGLLWDAIDFEHAMVRVVRRVHWDHWTKQPTLEETTKTEESARILVLSESILPLLKEMKLESGGQGPVFADRNGNLLKYNAIQSAFNAGFVALGLPWRSTHICRHTYATLALMATRDVGSVQASLGHTNPKMTERYAKIVALLCSSTAEKTAALLNLPENHTQNHTTVLPLVRKL